jgi:tetraacyldisaccharide 4'-kinase
LITPLDERSYLDVISGRRSSFTAGATRGGLALAVPAYGTAVAGRNWLFDAGLKRVLRVGVPVVSVGNLTTGGTGKTPVVAWMCEWFRARGVQPCLVSRGYRSLEAGGNDERRVLAQLCPQVPHVQHRDRVAAAREAIEQHAAEVVVLDDGFQHRRLHRDLDIVLIDITNPWGYGHLLPRGLLREPASALRRANLVMLTRVDQGDAATLERVRDEVRRAADVPIVEVAFRPTLVVSLHRETASVDSLAGQPLAAFCGIGNPAGFRQTLRAAGYSLEEHHLVRFRDHHHYTPADWQKLTQQAHTLGAAALVTTQKDLVKLNPDWQPAFPVWAVVIGAEIISGRDELERLLSACIPETSSSPEPRASATGR